MIGKERNVIDILKIIIEIIPKNELDLLDELNKFATSLWNQAPELLTGKYLWLELMNILNRKIPNITEDWQFKIKKIINNE